MINVFRQTRGVAGAGPRGARWVALLLWAALAHGCATAVRCPGGTVMASDGSCADRRLLLLDPANPEWSRPAPPVSRIRFETSQGPFEVEALREWAPLGVDRFYNLVRLGFYDDARFHRVNANYIVQFGLSGDPAVTAAWRGFELRDDPPRSRNERGTFAFAMMGPHTRLTQIYINLGDNSRNDGEPFSILGRVIEGMDVLDRLYSGYGERSGSGMRQGRQGPIEQGGNVYLDREYPLLDRLLRACVVAPVESCR